MVLVPHRVIKTNSLDFSSGPRFVYGEFDHYIFYIPFTHTPFP